MSKKRINKWTFLYVLPLILTIAATFSLAFKNGEPKTLQELWDTFPVKIEAVNGSYLQQGTHEIIEYVCPGVDADENLSNYIGTYIVWLIVVLIAHIIFDILAFLPTVTGKLISKFEGVKDEDS